MSAGDKGVKLYAKGDMVDATFNGEEVQIPKKWVGTEYADGYVVAEGKATKSAEPVTIPEGAPTDEWTVPQIDKYAADNAVVLDGAKKKDEKLALIVAHHAAANTPS